MADLYIKSIGYNESGSRAIRGDFLHIRACTHPFHVEITDNQSQQVIYEVDAGDQFLPSHGFTEIRVINDLTSASLDAEIIYGFGDFKRGARVISSISNILNPIDVKPVKIINSNPSHLTGLVQVASGATSVVVSQATNVNGIVIHGFTLITDPNSALASASLIASKAGSLDTLIAQTKDNLAGRIQAVALPLHLGAGVGISITAFAAGGSGQLIYELL